MSKRKWTRREKHERVCIKLQLAGFDLAPREWYGHKIRRAIVVFYEPAPPARAIMHISD